MSYEMRVQDAPDYELATCIERDFPLGTARLCQAMIELGMAHQGSMPDFSASDPLDRSDFVDEQPATDRARIYMQALAEVQADHGTDRLPGIPAHKLASGDGWHVTVLECVESVGAYELAVTAGAARYGGFRVH
ncbi:hypothetical protein [Amycolatopsis magusensis]|uniref:hypothetical protein n=1 Tax=Amycolatopsis magusensis TaxID=882444 RepID=UPI00379252BD